MNAGSNTFSGAENQGYQIGNAVNSTIHFNQSTSFSQADYHQCLRSLLLTDPSDDLTTIRRTKEEKVKGTCEWITEREEYRAWLNGDGLQILRLAGAPGIGKTMISSFLVHKLENETWPNSDFMLAYYFCDNKDENRNTATTMLRGVLYQLLKKQKDFFSHFKHDYAMRKDKLAKDFTVLWRIFVDILKDMRGTQVYFIIDAIDECEQSSRQDFLKSLSALFTIPDLGSTHNIKFLITSRPEHDIECALKSVGNCLRVDSGLINEDLSRYIDVKVKELSSNESYSPHLTHDIKKALRKNAGGTFLWVSFVLREISDVESHRAVKAKLELLPTSLSDVYGRILGNIKRNKAKVAASILQWIVVAHCPLTIDELAMAQFVTNRGWRDDTTLDLQKVDECKQDYRSCGPLLALDSKNQTVNLVHQSVKEYLLNKNANQSTSNLGQYQIFAEKTHMRIFETCWKFARSVLDGSDYSNKSLFCNRGFHEYHRPRFKNNKFLRYAHSEWIEHAISGSQVIIQDDDCDDFCWTPLCGAARNGQEATVEFLLESGADINIRNEFGETPLFLAIGNSHEAVVTLLLRKNASTDIQTMNGYTALHCAISYTRELRELMVALLLKSGADPNIKDGNGNTVLHSANKSEPLMAILLRSGADPNIKDGDGRTALHLAMKHESESLMTLLLKSGADPNIKHEDGNTTLNRALELKESMVILLLENGANPNMKDKNGDTILHFAWSYKPKSMITLLLKSGADPNIKNDRGDTALNSVLKFKESEKLTESAMTLLLENRADPNMKNNSGKTALHLAAKLGTESIIALLLDKGADPNIKNEFCYTALHLAAELGTKSIIALLLENEADPNIQNKFDDTVLHLAVGFKYEIGSIALLLEKGADPNIKDEYGDTALHLAIYSGVDSAIPLLLEHGADPDIMDQDGDTALECAMKFGEQAIIDLLRKHKASTSAQRSSTPNTRKRKRDQDQDQPEA